MEPETIGSERGDNSLPPASLSPAVLAALLFLLFLGRSGTHAQELAEEVSQFVGDNAVPFLQPLADAVHATVQEGLFVPTTADRFQVGVRIVGMLVSVPDERKTFTPRPYSKTVEFTYNGIPFLGDLEIAPAVLPTAVGLGTQQSFTGQLTRIRPKGSPYVPGLYDFIRRDTTVTIGGYQDVATLLFATPQVSLGPVAGTELIVRYLPAIRIEDIGEVGLFGIGVRHDLARHFALPVDLAGQIVYQTISLSAEAGEFGMELDLAAVAVQLGVGKAFSMGAVTAGPYAVAGYESGSIDVQYEFADPYVGVQSLSFDADGSFRLAIGAVARIATFAFSADFNVAAMDGFSFGVGIGI